MKKKRRNILFSLIIAGSILFVILFMRLTNLLPSFYGFAVDFEGSLYIGSEGCLKVVDKNASCKKISIPLYSGNVFSIIDGNRIAIQKGNRVVYYDLDGKELFSQNQEQSIRPQENIFVTKGGEKYVLKSELGYYQIFLETEGKREKVYAMPVFEYLGYILLVLSGLTTVILIFIFVVNCLLDPTIETQYDLFVKRKKASL